MNIVKITLPSLPDSTVSVPLDGYTYLIRMQWLQRAEVWIFTLSDSSGNEIASSAVTPNSNILFPIRSSVMPSGDFFVYKTADASLTYDDVAGGGCPLYFVSED